LELVCPPDTLGGHFLYSKMKTKIIIGADEAGRGPWAGPLVAAVCHIPRNTRLPGLNDSKRLSEKARKKLFKQIEEKTQYGIGVAKVSEVEKGMMYALNKAYNRALKQIDLEPDLLMIDGRDKLDLKYPYKSIIKGDQKERCIMAASIIAKVTRDEMMTKLATSYPEYGFDKHKGYGTRQHKQNIEKYGICKIHRRNFYIMAFGKVLGNLTSLQTPQE